MRDKTGFVYIIANKQKGTFYVGVTSDLIRRVWQHRNGETGGFTSRYNVKLLVYYECFDDISTAISREKILKRWKRSWRINLIAGLNPDWCDLYDELIMDPASSAG